MFGISLSGIHNSQKYLDVTSNNIANANTIGFKKSRAEFADVYTNSVYVNSKTATGMGSQNSVVSQQFFQGNLSGDTGNSMDMAITGSGFFVLSGEKNDGTSMAAAGDRTYTRAGAFQVDKNGYIVTAQGDYLQGWDVNENGEAQNLDIYATHAIKIPADTGAPKASSQIGIGVNLPAGAEPVEGSKLTSVVPPKYEIPFDPKDSKTYTCSTSQTIHDSLGNEHTLTYYMMKARENDNNNTSEWVVVPYVDGKPVDIANAGGQNAVEVGVPTGSSSSIAGNKLYGFKMVFDSSGKMITQVPAALHLANANSGFTSPRQDPLIGPYDGLTGNLNNAMGGGIDDTQDIIIDFTATQYGSSTFQIQNGSIKNDGYSTGTLIAVSVGDDGIITAEYTNGRMLAVAKVAMADFANPQGLTKIGDTQWRASNASGNAVPKEAGLGGAGSIKGSNLEESNVDLTAELVSLIIGQRNYQANAQALQTQNTAMDSVMNIR